MAPAAAAAIIALGRECPHWGPRKLRAVLMRERPEVAWPAPNTVGDLLCAEGLAAHRRRHRRVTALCQSLRTLVSVVHRLQRVVPRPRR